MSQTSVGNLSVELGISDDQLRAGLAAAVVQAQQAGQKMQAAMNNAASKTGSGFGANGMLQLSRAVDDVQYGLRGVINNIEGIVTGFGGSAGMAGAATIAAVAIGALAPKIYEAVTAATPLSGLADDLKKIANSGLDGTFSGMAASAKAMNAAFEASVKQLEKMEKQSQRVVFAAGGPGMGAAPQMQTVGASMQDIANQRMTVDNMARNAAKEAFAAQIGKQSLTAGGLAEFDLSSNSNAMQDINKKIFQAAIDKFGNGQDVFKRLDFMTGGEKSSLYGDFKRGDIQASNEAVQLLGLQAEKAKLLAEDYDAVTGSAKELADIQKASNKQMAADFEAMVSQELERQKVQSQIDKTQSRVDRIMSQRARSEILGGAADVFNRNLNAGMEDPQVKELQGLRDDIRKYTDELRGLG
jgi:hypothetical protein